MRHLAEEKSTRVALAPSPQDEDLALLVLTGPARGRYYKVPRKGGVVGREHDLPLRIDDPGISRHHCRIERNDRGYFEVQDLDSRFGTFVEGNAIQRQVVLDGDRIQVSAETTFRVRYQNIWEPEGLEQPTSPRVRDPLTRVYNRRYLLERFEQEYAFARRHHSPLSLLMLDFDHFQRINDDHGRSAGDGVLRAVARILHHTVRTEDILARVGGDEFMVLVRHESAAHCLEFAERILGLIRQRPLQVRDQELQITCSIGISNYGADCPYSMMELMVQADAALNEAKRQGRDRVATFAPDDRGLDLD